jgi:hypothetical protein
VQKCRSEEMVPKVNVPFLFIYQNTKIGLSVAATPVRLRHMQHGNLGFRWQEKVFSLYLTVEELKE